jgi:DNA (cytosine-5)-methyltransferase 1
MQKLCRERKIQRLKAGKKPRVLDLFAGCGGISLGFDLSGFEISAAIEFDPIAARTHALNFHLDDPRFEKHAEARDITKIEPDELIEELALGDKQSAIDVIVGGPPCQAFARVGRAKLREIQEHPEAFKNDPRANLYLRFVHYVKELQPLALVMENVPDVLNFGGHNIPEEICEVLDDLGYNARYTLLNAVYYGVPEMRERMFLVAYAKELKAEITFPAPTNWVDLPRGYLGSRQVALKSLNRNLLNLDDNKSYYYKIPEASPALPPAVTAKEALLDLPPITIHLEGKLKKGARPLTELYPYATSKPSTTYGKLMRNWPGFENKVGVYDHIIRYLPRDYAIFRRMNPGDQYPQAYQHAVELFHEKLKALEARGQTVKEGSKEYQELKKVTIPPYDASKFPNKWRKMEADLPARTLMAHLGKDSYSHIHYDSNQARTISVREAARLQSFPDGFKFAGSMNAMFRQVGNAVPPLLANAIANEIFRILQSSSKENMNESRGKAAAVR